MIEYSNIYTNEDGTEVEIKVKTECVTSDEMKQTLSFIAQSAHKFYLEIAEKINNTL